ncbi:hypothetical protein [Pseudomonas sp. DY-1]|uniref:hypothetical protein n=1 Tax=Pseudomonas sp. DY-1 TaxID=1755504 RepID=UPI0015AEA076|nr:hypothetical protein [Pseudomonas sp. DY-1]
MRALSVLVLLAAFGVAHGATFDGNDCLDDCSGHQAGYEWAESNDIDDDSACSTDSPSFNEGCQSFVDGGGGFTEDEDEDDDDEEEDE